MRRVVVVLAVVAGAGLAPAGEGGARLGKVEKALLGLLNEARRKEKLPPLEVNAQLCKAARLHSENMARQEKMAHKLDGKGVGERVDAAGYDWGVVRENLAVAEGDADSPAPTPAEIHTKWMESKGHRANILNAKVKEVGLAVVRSKKGTYYYTEVFAAARK